MGQRLVSLMTSPRLRRVLAHPALRVSVTLLALVIFIHSVNIGSALATFGHLRWEWAVVAFALAGLSVVASIIEWGALMRGAGKMLGWRYLGGWYVKGLFLNQVLPAGIGSDAVRAIRVGKVVGHGPVIASLVGSRMAGALCMALWGLCGAILMHSVFRVTDLVGFATFSGLMLAAWAAALGAEFVVAKLTGRDRIRASCRVFAVIQKTQPFVRSLSRFRGQPDALGCSILAGAAAWGLNLLSMVTFSQALGHEIPWGVFALALPVALLVTFIPITANGLGVREGVLVFLLVQFHVPVPIAVAMSLFMDFQLIPYALLGALVHLLEVALRQTSRQLSRAGVVGRGFRVAHGTLLHLVAPEYIIELGSR